MRPPIKPRTTIPPRTPPTIAAILVLELERALLLLLESLVLLMSVDETDGRLDVAVSELNVAVLEEGAREDSGKVISSARVTLNVFAAKTF